MNSAQSEHPGDAEKTEFSALLSAAVDGVIVIDDAGLITEFNAAAERQFGYKAEEVRGKAVEILMPEPHRSDHAGYLKRYLETHEAHVIGIGREVEGQRRDGSLFPLWLSIGDAETSAGRRFVGILRDLTAQRRAERNQAELQDRLEHVARFSLMGEMAAGIAHEINQPLSAIATYSQAGRRLLEGDGFSVEELRTMCSRISEQGHRAAAVIENLRGFIRKQEPTRTRIDINSTIKAVMSLIQADVKNADLEVHLEFADDLPQINANAVQIQQVVLNLTRNAVDAMRDARQRARGIIIRTEKTSDGKAVISVIDHGAGVAKGLNDAVFHPFVSTKTDGLGVGLAISKTIVTSHGGELSYRSNPEGGAIFNIVLPPSDSETNE